MAAQRGHNVTLYEKTGRLGGQILVTENVDFKWPLQSLRKYLAHQIGKSSVQVRFDCAPTPEQLQAENYDVIIAAVGAEPVVPSIPGTELPHVMDGHSAYHRVNEIGQRVVIIGGGEIGVETGIYLARMGKDVTVFEMRSMLAEDSTPVHYYKMFRDEWEKLSNFTGVCNAKVSCITPDGVAYRNADGNEHSVPADTVIVATGVRAMSEEALRYSGISKYFYMIGDCRKAGNIQKCMRSAFLTANQF